MTLLNVMFFNMYVKDVPSGAISLCVLPVPHSLIRLCLFGNCTKGCCQQQTIFPIFFPHGPNCWSSSKEQSPYFFHGSACLCFRNMQAQHSYPQHKVLMLFPDGTSLLAFHRQHGRRECVPWGDCMP